jgi:putative nucleotidyltransferase with HDIG domain
MARIVLSGYADQSLVLRSVGVAHRYLAKPCALDDLQNIISRAMALRRMLANSSLRALVSQLSTIPSLPRVYQELMAEIQSSTASLKELGQIVAQDVAMTAKILQIVNSAFFGLPRRVADPVQAVCLLGIDVLKALVMTVHVFPEPSVGSLKELGLHDLWKHSAETAALAKALASAEGCEREVCDHALMAGLLHDAGKLILAANQTERYREALRLSAERGIEPCAAEQEVFGATHAEVGAYLLGLWGLCESTVEAVAFHHQPALCQTTGFVPLTAVHVANALHDARARPDDEQPPRGLDQDYLRKCGLGDRWATWRAQYLNGNLP